MHKWKTDQELLDEFLECDHEGEDALRTLEDARDNLEVLAEVGMEEAGKALQRVGTLIMGVLRDRVKTGNTYGEDYSNFIEAEKRRIEKEKTK